MKWSAFNRRGLWLFDPLHLSVGPSKVVTIPRWRCWVLRG